MNLSVRCCDCGCGGASGCEFDRDCGDCDSGLSGSIVTAVVAVSATAIVKFNTSILATFEEQSDCGCGGNYSGRVVTSGYDCDFIVTGCDSECD